jgi:hypothetical protein
MALSRRSARFLADPRFELELLRSPGVGEAIQPLTARTAARAKEITRYRGIAAGISAIVAENSEGKIVGRVVGDDMKTGWAEFGTSRIPQERALGRALEETVGPIASSGDA